MSPAGDETDDSPGIRLRGPVFLMGTGNMGGALARAWVRAGLRGERIRVYDADPRRAAALADELGCRVSSPEEGMRDAESVVLAFKPQDLTAAAADLARVEAETTVVSILAGVRTSRLESVLREGVGVVRAMPNLGVTVGFGVTALFGGSRASPADMDRALALLEAAGRVVVLERENQMDAVTAVSGSGPAYFFLLAEALAEAGVRCGLPAPLAAELASGTAIGAGRLLAETEGGPGELRRRVTSKGGTTERALEVFEREGFFELVERAVKAAEARSRELSAGS